MNKSNRVIGMIYDADSKSLVNSPPDEIPTGMYWSFSANGGQGMLCYLPPKVIPNGKTWRKKANGGKLRRDD